RDAWEEIVRRYRGLVAATVRSFRLQDADAHDAEQRTWLRLVEHHRRLRDPHGDVEQRVVDAVEAEHLWNVVTLLPPRGRAVVQALFADDRVPYAEVARTTGIPVGSLGPTRARVLRQLRHLLEDGSPATARAAHAC